MTELDELKNKLAKAEAEDRALALAKAEKD